MGYHHEKMPPPPLDVCCCMTDDLVSPFGQPSVVAQNEKDFFASLQFHDLLAVLVKLDLANSHRDVNF